MAVNPTQDAGYERSSPFDKGSNETLRDITGGRVTGFDARDITGQALSNAEMGQLQKLGLTSVFNLLPEGLQDFARDAANQLKNGVEVADASGAVVGGADAQRQLREVVANLQPDQRAALEQQLKPVAMTPEQVADNPQEFATRWNEHLRSLPPEDRAAFERRMEETLEQTSPRRMTEVVQELESIEPSHSAMAFAALVLGSGEAGRIHEYLRSQGVDGTLAGSYGDDDDESSPEEKQRRDAWQQQQMLENFAAVSASMTEFANDILNHDFLTPEEIAALEQQIEKYQAELNELNLQKANTLEELQLVQERIAGFQAELTDIEQRAEETKLTLDGATEAIQAVTQAREEAMAGLRPAYREFNSVADEAARAMGLDPENAWIYKDEQTGEFVVMNLDFTSNDGGSTTNLRDRVPADVLERLEGANAKISEIWDTASFHGESLQYLETFMQEQREELDNLKEEAERLRQNIAADQARAAELQGQLDTLDTRISEIETKMAEAQLQLDYNAFLSRDDVQRLASKMANPNLSQEARAEAAQEIYNLAPANVQEHLRQRYPRMYDPENAPSADAPAADQPAVSADTSTAEVSATGQATQTENNLDQGMNALATPTTDTVVTDPSARLTAANADGQGIQGGSITGAFNPAATGTQPEATPELETPVMVPPQYTAQQQANAGPR